MTMPYDGDVKWIPVRTAAAQLGISMTRVYQLVDSGVLLSIKVDRTVLVSERSVRARRMERTKEDSRAA
jgi:excisionase family DNA binding protein